jgi:hypothetical protein
MVAAEGTFKSKSERRKCELTDERYCRHKKGKNVIASVVFWRLKSAL